MIKTSIKHLTAYNTVTEFLTLQWTESFSDNHVSKVTYVLTQMVNVGMAFVCVMITSMRPPASAVSNWNDVNSSLWNLDSYSAKPKGSICLLVK